MKTFLKQFYALRFIFEAGLLASLTVGKVKTGDDEGRELPTENLIVGQCSQRDTLGCETLLSTPKKIKMAVAAQRMAETAAHRIGLLFEQQGDSDYIGEPVSILEHCWQAYERAKEAGAPEHVQVALMLHDIGHMLGMEAGFPVGMEGCGIQSHEIIGGDFLLSLGAHEYVSWLVANHVNAKRFLVWQDPDYYNQLSDASRTTLRHQGGPMSDKEASAFMARPGYDAVLHMRTFDEAAKIPGLPKPSIEVIKAIFYKHVMDTQESGHGQTPAVLSSYPLSLEQLRFYREQGYLVIKGHPATVQCGLSTMANHLATLADKHSTETTMLSHHEEVTLPTGETRIQICRVENFLKCNPDWAAISKVTEDVCGELFGEHAVLFKDKLNYKLPGGGGFLAHQDVTAYKTDEFASTHISAMVAIDPAKSDDVGPLQMAKGRHLEGVFENTKGVIVSEVEESMEFEPLYVDEGDLVFFGSYIPHRSQANMSECNRRIAYLTYNKLSEGDFNAAYYEAKLAVFRAGTGGSISINDDFAGKIV